MERLKLSMAEIGEAAGENPHVVYAAIKSGHLETFLVGRRRFARPEAVRKWIDFLQAQSDAGKPVVYQARGREAYGRVITNNDDPADGETRPYRGSA